nr:hypothetical protein [Streptomyces zingiberis]
MKVIDGSSGRSPLVHSDGESIRPVLVHNLFPRGQDESIGVLQFSGCQLEERLHMTLGHHFNMAGRGRKIIITDVECLVLLNDPVEIRPAHLTEKTRTFISFPSPPGRTLLSTPLEYPNLHEIPQNGRSELYREAAQKQEETTRSQFAEKECGRLGFSVHYLLRFIWKAHTLPTGH